MDQLSNLPENIQLLIAQAITKGIATDLQRQHSELLASESISHPQWASPLASLTDPPHHSSTHSRDSDDFFLGEETQRDSDFSDDEGVSHEIPAFMGLFPSRMVQILII